MVAPNQCLKAFKEKNKDETIYKDHCHDQLALSCGQQHWLASCTQMKRLEVKTFTDVWQGFRQASGIHLQQR